MQLTRLAVSLLIAVLIPPPLFSQHRQLAAPFKPQPQVEQIAAAVSELLKQRPLDPESAKEQAAAENDPAKENPPADDAPINELITYWRNHSVPSNADEKGKPSAKVRERILEACENRPWLLARLTHALPESSETYDRLYNLLMAEGKEQSGEAGWQAPIRRWLKSNSQYFREELVEQVRQLSQNNVMDISPIHTLVRLDWDAARPMVEAMADSPNPYRAAQALGIIFNQTQRDGDPAQADALRAQLKTLVINRQSPVTVRQIAFQSLMTTEWSGQEEWYLSLFADPLLSGVRLEQKKEESEAKSVRGRTDSYWQRGEENGNGFNILWLPIQENAAKWLPVVTRLVGNGNRLVHLAAVSCLAEYLAADASAPEQSQQAARALLPWLTDPNWGGLQERWSYLGGLAKIDLPESVPGLIWVLENDEDSTSRAVAAEALLRYKTPQATPALRRALDREKDEQLREIIIVALAQLGGFSDEEAAVAIEAYARRALTAEGQKEMAEIAGLTSEKSLPLPISIGRIYDLRDDIEIPESLAARLFARAKGLRPTEPAVARKILSIAENADLMIADLNLIERIGEGVVDLDAVKLALESRERMRKHAGDELFALFKQGGYAAGLAAVLLGDDGNWRDILKGKDTNAQTALLAAARYTRNKLPVDLTGNLLNANQMSAAVAIAAESYLEMEDSPEARKLIWARHPGEAKILGERMGPEINARGPLTQWEEKLRSDIRNPNSPELIFAIAPIFDPEISGTTIIRIRQDRAELSIHQATGRRKTRLLTADELQTLKTLALGEEVENLGPQHRGASGEVVPDQVRYEYLRLTKESGRRIMLAELRRAPKKAATLHEQLAGLFYQFSRSGEFKLRYDMEDKIPGLEVLLADDNRRVFTACQENGALRVLIEPERDERLRPANPVFEWRSFASGQLGSAVNEPGACQYQNSLLNAPDWLREIRQRAGLMIDRRSKFGDVWFSPALIEGETGLWKFEEDKAPVKLGDGTYVNSIATADGKWLVAKKTVQTDDKFEMQLTRINLQSDKQTGREFVINAPQLSSHYPIAFVAAHNKVLLGQGHYQYGRDFTGGTYYLLDPETGATQQVKGEFRPLQDQFTRPLQPTGRPNEFWAAIYDPQKKATVVGRYDARMFAFTPVVELPEIRIGSPDVWVDAAAGKVYVTYLGHLLRVPLMK